MDRVGSSPSPIFSPLFLSLPSPFLPSSPNLLSPETSCHQLPPSTQQLAASPAQLGHPPPPLSPQPSVRAGSAAREEKTRRNADCFFAGVPSSGNHR
ncbi:hypothetical protein ACLB2K_007032 [Fragaria x ananassa]